VNDDTLAARFAALADTHDDSDWLDVVRRAGEERGRSRARIVLPLAAAFVALIVGSAYAYHRGVVDFVGAEKAPLTTVADFESLDVGAPTGMAPGAIASETRRIEVTGIDGSHRVVFVAPTKAGGFCFVFREDAGGCDKYGTTPLSPTWGARSVTGHADARYVARVELHFADGSIVEPPITWVSSPIDRGFFFYTAPPGREFTSIVALADNGEVVTAQDLHLGPVNWDERATPPADAVTDEKYEIASISTSSGPATLWAAPARYDGTCAWVELDGRPLPFSVGCMPTGYWNQGFRPIVSATSETVLLHGSKPDRYPTLELRFADGDSQRVATDGNLFLVEVPQSHLRHDTRLVSVTFADVSGRQRPASPMELPARSHGGPPCYQTLPLSPGQTCP
jgi:hypothetical protein